MYFSCSIKLLQHIICQLCFGLIARKKTVQLFLSESKMRQFSKRYFASPFALRKINVVCMEICALDICSTFGFMWSDSWFDASWPSLVWLGAWNALHLCALLFLCDKFQQRRCRIMKLKYIFIFICLANYCWRCFKTNFALKQNI